MTDPAHPAPASLRGTSQWTVAACALVGLIFGLVLFGIRGSTYEAEALVAVSNPARPVIGEVANVTGAAVLDAAAVELGFEPDVSVTAAEVAQLLTITARADDPERAALAANTVASTYVERAEYGAAASVARDAQIPTSPAGVGMSLYALLGTMVGAVAGFAVEPSLRRRADGSAALDGSTTGATIPRTEPLSGLGRPAPQVEQRAVRPVACAASPLVEPLRTLAPADVFSRLAMCAEAAPIDVRDGVPHRAKVGATAAVAVADAAAIFRSSAADQDVGTEPHLNWCGPTAVLAIPSSFENRPTRQKSSPSMTSDNPTDRSSTADSSGTRREVSRRSGLFGTASDRPRTRMFGSADPEPNGPVFTLREGPVRTIRFFRADSPEPGPEPIVEGDGLTETVAPTEQGAGGITVVSTASPIVDLTDGAVPDPAQSDTTTADIATADASSATATTTTAAPGPAGPVPPPATPPPPPDATATVEASGQPGVRPDPAERMLAHNEELARLRSEHERRVSELRTEVARLTKQLRIQSSRLANRAEPDHTRVGDLEAQIDALEIELAQARQALESERINHAKKLTDERGASDRALDNIRRVHREELAKHLHTHRQALADHRNELDQELARDRAKHAAALEAQHDKYEAQIEAERHRYEAAVQSTSRRHEQELEKLRDLARNEVRRQAGQFKATIAQLRVVSDAAEERVQEVERENRMLRAALGSQQKQARHEQNDHAAAMADATEELATVRAELEAERERNAALRADVLRRSAESHQAIDRAVEERTAQLAELEASVARQRQYADDRVRDIAAAAEEEARQAAAREADLTATISRLKRELAETRDRPTEP